MRPEPKELTVTFTDGSTQSLRRCGGIPDLFASRDGDIFQIGSCQIIDHQKSATIRYRGKSIAARHLIADAWKPGWDTQYSAVVLKDKENCLDIAYDNLEFSHDARRGRPRSSKIQDQVMLARIAMQVNDIQICADECGTTDREVLDAVLTWFPQALHEMEGVPTGFLASKVSQDLSKRAEALQRRMQLREAEKRAKAAKLVK